MTHIDIIRSANLLLDELGQNGSELMGHIDVSRFMLDYMNFCTTNGIKGPRFTKEFALLTQGRFYIFDFLSDEVKEEFYLDDRGVVHAPLHKYMRDEGVEFLAYLKQKWQSFNKITDVSRVTLVDCVKEDVTTTKMTITTFQDGTTIKDVGKTANYVRCPVTLEKVQEIMGKDIVIDAWREKQVEDQYDSPMLR